MASTVIKGSFHISSILILGVVLLCNCNRPNMLNVCCCGAAATLDAVEDQTPLLFDRKPSLQNKNKEEEKDNTTAGISPKTWSTQSSNVNNDQDNISFSTTSPVPNHVQSTSNVSEDDVKAGIVTKVAEKAQEEQEEEITAGTSLPTNDDNVSTQEEVELVLANGRGDDVQVVTSTEQNRQRVPCGERSVASLPINSYGQPSRPKTKTKRRDARSTSSHRVGSDKKGTKARSTRDISYGGNKGLQASKSPKNMLIRINHNDTRSVPGKGRICSDLETRSNEESSVGAMSTPLFLRRSSSNLSQKSDISVLSNDSIDSNELASRVVVTEAYKPFEGSDDESNDQSNRSQSESTQGHENDGGNGTINSSKDSIDSNELASRVVVTEAYKPFEDSDDESNDQSNRSQSESTQGHKNDSNSNNK